MANRREFLQLTGAGLMSLSAKEPAIGAGSAPDRLVEQGNPLREVQYHQVQFASGLHDTQLTQSHAVLMSLNEDSLLRPYRLSAGIAAPGCDLGGWYSSDLFEAETLGQWISALSRYYAISGDEPTRAKVDRLVRKLASTVEASGRLYGKKPSAYLYDKLTCGLIDAHQFARQPIALDVLSSVTSAAMPHLPHEAVEGAGESYTLPENQFIAWQRGGSSVHLEIAKQYLYHSFFEPLARGENVLAGRHAYSHVNSLCSAAKGYLVLGDRSLLQAAKNGFSFIEAQSFATGGWGPNETFIPMLGKVEYGIPGIKTLADSLTRTHTHFETPCGSYAHFKLTRYLLRITRDSTYGDSMERIMFNTVIGAKPLLRDGRAFYQSDYNSEDAHKVYFDGYGGSLPSQWPCCSGTLPQVAADYRISAYFTDPESIYVNLFIPSTFTCCQNGDDVTLTQSGSYPLGDVVQFSVSVSGAREFAIRVRIPAWTLQPSASINGRRVSEPVRPGTFLALRRRWQDGDHIDLELPHALDLKAVDAEHPDIVAVTYGPLVLFAVTADVPRVTRQELLGAQRTGPESSEWKLVRGDQHVRLVPFWEIASPDIRDMESSIRYMTYFTTS